MVEDTPAPDPSWFRCYYCSGKIYGPLPPDAWVKGVLSPEYRSVCMSCRTSRDNPRPDPKFYRCLDCNKNIPIPEVERAFWQHDPAARIREIENGGKYVGRCPECASVRVLVHDARSRARDGLEARARQPWWQMTHIRELLLGYQGERDTEGRLRYTEAQAIERAVWLEMLVDDASRFPAFMAWLHVQEVGEVGEVDRVEDAA